MTHVITFLSGFALCFAFCWKRLRESRRAFNAASELIEVAYGTIERQQGTLSNIRGLALRMKKDSDLGGPVTLPAAANRNGQHSTLQCSVQRYDAIDGAVIPRRPRFLGREE